MPRNIQPQIRLPHHVVSEAKTRQKMLKNRSLYGINEDFEAFFNAVMCERNSEVDALW